MVKTSQHVLIDSYSQNDLWMSIEGSVDRSNPEMGINEFILALTKSHKRMETQDNLCGSLTHFLLAYFGLET